MRPGLADSATKILGPCAVIQGALPSILANTPKSFFDETMRYIEVCSLPFLTVVFKDSFCIRYLENLEVCQQANGRE